MRVHRACQGVNPLRLMINTRPRASVQRDRKEEQDKSIFSTDIGDDLG
jgi:hypothetical protein